MPLFIEILSTSANVDMVKMLVQNGADVHKSNNRGFTALDIAINYGTITLRK